MMTRNECAAWLAGHDNFCILTHPRPDGDTLGSATALCLGLRQLGKQAWVLENSEASPFLYQCMLGLTTEAPAEGDTLVCVDVSAPGMLQPNALPYLDRVSLRIDHHGSATSFTPHELVEPGTAACGEIIYEVMNLMGVEMTRDIALRLYIAVSTDTGCFRYANTTAHSYEVAAACAATGAELYPITQALFDTNSLGKLKVQGWMVNNARFLAGGKAAVCAIPKELEDSVSKDDMEGVAGFLRSIEGIQMAAVIREAEDCRKLSVRAVPAYDAAAVCRKFGGGGHRGAAGATLALPAAEALEQVAAALEEAVK